MPITIKYIPQPTERQLDEINAGKLTGGIRLVSLMVPDMEDKHIQELRRQVDYNNNKDTLLYRYQMFMSGFRNGKYIVRLYGSEKSVKWWGAFIENKTSSTAKIYKDDLVNFEVLFEWTWHNDIELIKLDLMPAELAVMSKMVEEGGIDLQDLLDHFIIKYKNQDKFRYYGYGYGYMREPWVSDPRVKKIFSMSTQIRYRSPGEYIDDRLYLIPDARMIRVVLDSKSVTPYTLKPIDAENVPKDRTVFSIGSEAIEVTALTLASMIEANVLVNGKTKIGQNVLKKVSQVLNLPDLPVILSPYDNVMTSWILAHLMLLGSSKQSKPNVREALSGMLECLRSSNMQLIDFLVSDSLHKVPSSVAYVVRTLASRMVLNMGMVNVMLEQMPADEWIDMQSFRNNVILQLAIMKVGLAPECSYEWKDKIRLAEGELIKPSQIKSRLYDVLLDSLILTFAAMGGYELMVSERKAIALRLTPLGRWYVSPKNEFPEMKHEHTKDSDFEVDDSLMMIRVKNPSSPYLSILKEFADQVMSNRYRLSDVKLLKGCKSKKDLDNKLQQLTNYVLGKPGPVISEHFKTLSRRFNCVEPTPGGTTYRLFDVRPDDPALLRLITEDEDILHNTLRVEGCRLLIKHSYIATFVDKLRRAGYPVVL